MADPFTIIGATAAIIQLSHFAGKIIQTAYSIYNSTSDQTTSHESIENVTSKLTSLLADLHNGSSPQDGQNQGLPDLAKKTHSLRVSLKAGFKTHWMKTDVEALHKELADCQNLLGLYMMNTIRSDFGGKLQEIVNSNSESKQELQLLRQEVTKIQGGGQNMRIESLDKLHHLLVNSESRLQAMKRNRILNSLKFDGMGSRYRAVSSNTPKTYNWCLQDLEVPKSHPELQFSFRRWLVRGTGIYHISGKPGAGKSTLMKFIVEHEDNQRYLEEWAGNRTLVVAKCFFWKPGKRLEKSLDGLIRTIIHTILKAVPAILPKIFPQYWNPGKESPWEIGWKYGGHQRPLFLLFIDGLDEFEDRDVEHVILVNRLKSWAEGSSANCKICVSSREENAFINNFPAAQRMRLHLLTMDDVRKTVECSLGNHKNFTEHNTPKDCQIFVELVVNKAEGVFLWVRLVLHKLEEDLEVSGSLNELRETLEHVPKELGDLFSTLLTSNDLRHQKEAWAIVAVLMAADQRYFTFLSVFDYSFIKEFSGTRDFPKQ
ncbi:hypothetical protein IFR05_014142 [Cadophora sp. M221]|nr:hypothetical protein IFR05_014142 [Cadophora sp. M221]